MHSLQGEKNHLYKISKVDKFVPTLPVYIVNDTLYAYNKCKKEYLLNYQWRNYLAKKRNFYIYPLFLWKT